MDYQVDNQQDYHDLTVREYAQHFNLPEQTVRSRMRLGKLNCVDVIRNGISQRGIRVSLSNLHNHNDDNQSDSQGIISKLSDDKHLITRELSPVIRPDYQMIIDNNEARIKELKEQITKLENDNHEKKTKIDELIQKLADERARAARAEGQLLSKDETIEALRNDLASKDETILSNKAAIMLMEKQRPSIHTETPKQIETSDKKPWWKFGL